MSPSLALLLWFVLLVGLFWYDPARTPKTSAALWVPLTWFFFLGSRTPTMWLGLSYGSGAQALEEGSPLDRTIFLLLTVASFAILLSRSFQWGKFLRQNSALALFLAFALLSVTWSDFPLATFKKWFRDVGVCMAALVVLSDARPLEAVRTVLRRLCYLLIPLSILLVKYYPNLGKSFSPWGGQEYTGVSTSKNMLGALCLVSGIFFFWDTVTNWHERRKRLVKRVILVDIAFIGMTLWLLNLSDSKTSTICLVIGCLMIAAAHSSFGRRHPRLVKALAPASFLLYLILTFGFGMGAQLSQAVGKSGNMSDRTHIWEVLLTVPINPVLGTGYQSFWLGPRVQWIWARLNGDSVMSAHNGYLQIYLDLGAIGFLLFCMFLIATYRKICKRLNPLMDLGSLGFGLLTLLLFYNISEAFFEVNLLFVTLLLSTISVSGCAVSRVAAPRAVDYDLSEPAASTEIVGQHWQGVART
ncbi:MAG: O-antigen ligase family protein [Terriglobales bacterium]